MTNTLETAVQAMPEVELIHGIQRDIYRQSEAISETIFDESETIKEHFDCTSEIVENFYQPRIPFIQELIGTTGRREFTPKSMYDAVADSDKLYREAREALVAEFNLTPLDSEEGEAVRQRYRVLGMLRENLKNEDYLNNAVPKHLIERSKEHTKDEKAYLSSPKMSRWLARLVGENSPYLAWYTNRCPKGSNVLGERSEYRMILSTLPHDIVGMSYYAPYNFDGDNWIDGYHGTSCMDTIRNGSGDSMYQLPPNLSDETMFVVSLVKSDYTKPSSFEDLEEIMTARMLVRVVNVKGKYIMLGQRVYATTRDTQKLITEAMKVEFGDSYVHCNELSNYSGGTETIKYEFEYLKQAETTECGRCEGSGRDNWGDRCGTCRGEGRVVVNQYGYRPYNDNPNQIEFTHNGINFDLPKRFLEELGL